MPGSKVENPRQATRIRSGQGILVIPRKVCPARTRPIIEREIWALRCQVGQVTLLIFRSGKMSLPTAEKDQLNIMVRAKRTETKSHRITSGISSSGFLEKFSVFLRWRFQKTFPYLVCPLSANNLPRKIDLVNGF